jgi:hypothetical protein
VRGFAPALREGFQTQNAGESLPVRDFPHLYEGGYHQFGLANLLGLKTLAAGRGRKDGVFITSIG